MKIGLYVILDRGMLRGREIGPLVEQLLDAGVKWFQYRDKISPDEDCRKSLAPLAAMCENAGVKLILNDRVGIAESAGVHGVHLGSFDMPLREARRILGRGKIIGATVRDPASALRAQAEGADYLGAGAAYETGTKPDAPVIGPRGISEICRCARLPVVGIGGINGRRVREILAAGVGGVAVGSAVLLSDDAGEAARAIIKEIEEFFGG